MIYLIGDGLTILNPRPDPEDPLSAFANVTFEADVAYSITTLPGPSFLVLEVVVPTGRVLGETEPLPVSDSGTQPLTISDVALTTIEESVFLRAVILDADGEVVLQSAVVEYTVRGGQCVAPPEFLRPLSERSQAGCEDYTISHLEVTQSIQNDSNTVPLVAEKKTVVRVFVERNTTPALESPLITGYLEGFRDDQPLGRLTPVKPRDLAEAISQVPNPRLFSTNYLLFVLPDDWVTEGTIKLKATINLDDTGAPIVPEDEGNTSNNVDEVRPDVKFEPRIGVTLAWADAVGDRAEAAEIPFAPSILARMFPTPRVRYFPLERLYEELLSAILGRGQSATALQILYLLVDGGLLPTIVTWVPIANNTLGFNIDRFGPGADISIVASIRGYTGVRLARAVARRYGVTSIPRTDQDPCGGIPLFHGIGFDTDNFWVKLPEKHDSLEGGCRSRDAWISEATYRALYKTRWDETKFVPAPELKGQSAATQYLLVAGTVSRDGTSAEISPLFRASSTSSDPPLPAEGEYCLEQRSDSMVLSRHCFELLFLNSTSEGFGFRLPPAEGVNTIALTRLGQEIATRTASANPPSLQLVSPANDALIPENSQITLAWMAADPDGDPLLYQAQYSSDGGETWAPAAINLTEPSVVIDSTDFTGGPDVFFRVLASDGFHAVEQAVGPLNVMQRPALGAPAIVSAGSAGVGQTGFGFVEMTNSGSGPLTVTAAVFDDPVFAVETVLPVLINTGDDFPLSVSFTPAAVGEDQATLTVTTDAPSKSTVNIVVRAEGLDPSQPIFAADGALDTLAFGDAAIGTPERQLLTIGNRGESEMTVEIQVEGEAFRVGEQEAALQAAVEAEPPRQDAFTLGRGEQFSIPIDFTPTAADDFLGRLTLLTNAPNRPEVEVQLSGIGVEPVPRPTINPGGVADAASFGPTVVPGGIAALFGVELADGLEGAPDTPLPLELQGAGVFVDGWAAPLFFVSAGQINFQVPYQVSAGGTASVVVRRNGVDSVAESVAVADYAPGLFIFTGEPIVVRFADGSLITAANPARPGDVLILYLNGVGDLTNPPPTGAVALASPLSVSNVAPTVTVGGAPAQVFFAGLTPGLVALVQMNIQLPDVLPPGDSLELIVDFDGSASRPVNLPVASP